MAMEFEIEERFSTAPERVFDALTELHGAHAWMPNLVRIEPLTDGPVGQGSRWREVRKMYGKEVAVELEVTGYTPPRELELYADHSKGGAGGGEFRFRYTLEPQGSGTLLRLRARIGGMGLVRGAVFRLFAGSMKKALRKDHQALREYLVQQGDLR